MAYHIKYFSKMNVYFIWIFNSCGIYTYIHIDHQNFDTWPCIFQDIALHFLGYTLLDLLRTSTDGFCHMILIGNATWVRYISCIYWNRVCAMTESEKSKTLLINLGRNFLYKSFILDLRFGLYQSFDIS